MMDGFIRKDRGGNALQDERELAILPPCLFTETARPAISQQFGNAVAAPRYGSAVLERPRQA
jgi:hypothetical protein